jgi:hypothetical protein
VDVHDEVNAAVSAGGAYHPFVMGFLDVLLNRKNLTFDWVADPHLQLVVDLDDSSFCGVPVGGPLKISRHSGQRTTAAPTAEP